MRERPILMSGPMVRAILAGTKTQTRRPVKSMPPQPDVNCHPQQKQRHPAPYFDAYCGQRKTEANPRGMSSEWCWWQVDDRQCLPTIKCTFGQPGDRLWVRESFMPIPPHEVGSKLWDIVYGADATLVKREAPETYRPMLYNYERWSPSIHMPRWACRLVLEIVSVRVERVQGISAADAAEEGMSLDWYSPEHDLHGTYDHYRDAFEDAWNRIYAARGNGWDANPWVWVVEFKRVEASA